MIAEPRAHQHAAGGGGVALVEHQVHDQKHAAETLVERIAGGDLVRNAGVADLLFRTDEPLSHGRYRHEKRARHLFGLEPGDRAQGQREPGFERERRVTAGEDQAEHVVFDSDLGRSIIAAQFLEPGNLVGALSSQRAFAELVDRLVAGGPHQPRARRIGDAVARPLNERRFERGLQGILGEIHVSQGAHQAREHPPVVSAKAVSDFALDAHPGRVRFGCDYMSKIMIGRTSIVPVVADGIFAAIAVASSRFSASIR